MLNLYSFPESVKAFESSGAVIKIRGGDGITSKYMVLIEASKAFLNLLKKLMLPSIIDFLKLLIMGNDMEIIWTKEIDALLSIGYYLGDFGIRNWGLSKQQVFQALQQFDESQVAIIGGDVFEEINGNIQPKYDNWYCETYPEETSKEFITRSLKETKFFIENYKINEASKIYYVLVLEINKVIT